MKFNNYFVFIISAAFLLLLVWLIPMNDINMIQENPQIQSRSQTNEMVFSVERVIDGDTFVIWIKEHPPTLRSVSVRINGIDAPELKGKCEQEIALARRAKEELETLIGDSLVKLSELSFDRWGGRVNATVHTISGVDIANVLLEKKLAVVYTGRGPRPEWCLN